MTQFVKIISTNEITMLKDIDNLITINKNGKFKYQYIPCLQIREILDFISKLDNDSFYTIIPIISMFGKDNDPQIILSKQILVSNNSSATLIYNFLNNKLEFAIQDFGVNNLDNGNYFHLIFKYKKVVLDFSKLL